MTIIKDAKAAFNDIMERSVATFMQAFVAVLSAGDGSALKSAAVAGVAALLSMVKSVVATKIGNKGTASISV